MAIYQMYHDLPKFKVAYGATISGISAQQLEYLKQTQPKRIKLKWTGQLNDDISLLDDILPYDFELALDANESLDVSDFQKLESINDQNILYVESHSNRCLQFYTLIIRNTLQLHSMKKLLI